MSQLKAVVRLRSFHKSLVGGYLKTNYTKYVPRDIFRLCLLFCFMLDEFSTILPSNTKAILIEGLNNELIKFKSSPSHNPVVTVIGRNIIKPHSGSYHWRLKLSNIHMSKTGNCIKMGWIHTDQQTTIIHSHSLFNDFNRTWNTNENTFDLYFDTNAMETCTIHNHHTASKNIQAFEDDTNNYSFAIQFIGCDAHIELQEYHESKWYNKQNNNEYVYNPVMDIGLANCTHDEQLKIKYYRSALQINPAVEHWNNLYLLQLKSVGAYDIAYAHAIKYKYGINGISELADAYIDNRDIAKAYALLSLLTPSQLKSTQSNLKYGYCLKQMGDNIMAAKYMELHLNQLEEKKSSNDEDEDDEWHISNTLQHLGWAYYHSSDFVNGLRIFQRLRHEEIVKYNIEGAFAHCLEHDDALEALKYYKLYRLKYPHNPWAYLRMADLYQCQEGADDEQKQCLLKNIELNNDGEGKCHALWKYGEYLQDKENDYRHAHEIYLKALDVAKHEDQRRFVYCSMSINCHLLEQWRDAIKYGLEALKLKPNAPTLISNVAEYYFHDKQYENSYKYFKMAMQYDALSPLTNGYFAMLLYEWQRYDEAILYFEKYFEFQDGVKGNANNGMKSKCYQVFASIFWKKGNYEMSVDLCDKAIKDKDFETYKEKDQIYYLLSRNYSKCMDFKRALEYLQQAKQINPHRKMYHNQIKILSNTMEPQFDLNINALNTK